MPRRRFFAPGEWNALCDTCGRKFKSSELVRQWDGFMVCRQCHDPRHPQEFVRGVPDNMSVPWSRPRPPDSFNPFGDVSDRMLDGSLIDSKTLG